MNNFEYIRMVRDDDSLSSIAKLVAIIVASHYNWKTQEAAWTSNKTIATESSLSIRSVIRAKRELESKGYLASVRRMDSANLTYVLCPGGQLKDTLKDKLKDNNKSDSVESSLLKIDNFIQEDYWNIFDNPMTEDIRRRPAGGAL